MAVPGQALVVKGRKMIAPLRRAHRWIWIAQAILLPVLLALAIGSRA